MKHIILATLLIFSCGTLQAGHKDGEAHDYTKNFTIPKLQFKCNDGFEFAIVQTVSQLTSYQVMGENGLPLLCGPRQSDYAAIVKAEEASLIEAEALAQKNRDLLLGEQIRFFKILSEVLARTKVTK